MSINKIDAGMVQKMFLAGAKALEAKKEYINELNVFPVPDGDTGTNMTMTIMSAAKEVSMLKNPTMDELGKAISSGSLRGARGNSGVILSQIFRGFVKSIKGNDELDITIMGNAVNHAAETAYKAVMKPKEGTILTVASAGAAKAQEILVDGEMTDLLTFCDEVSQSMEEALLNTPELLPVLKQAGVVDSGGEGLMTFLRGAIDALNGRTADFTIKVGNNSTVVKASTAGEADIKFGYCTEFIIMLERNENVVEAQLKIALMECGIIPNAQYIKENYFDMFDKIGAKYKLKPDRYGNAKPEQVKYIGNIYTFYNSNRHPIDHWDDPTAPIDTTKMLDIKGAHDLIKRALAIIDEYYEVI